MKRSQKHDTLLLSCFFKKTNYNLRLNFFKDTKQKKKKQKKKIQSIIFILKNEDHLEIECNLMHHTVFQNYIYIKPNKNSMYFLAFLNDVSYL